MQIIRHTLKSKYLLLFFATLFVCEMILRIQTCNIFLGAGLILSFLFALSASCLLTACISFLSKKGKTIFSVLVVIFIIILFGAQLVYFTVFKTYFTLFSASKGAQVIDFIDVICTAVMQNGSAILIMFLPLLFFLITPTFKTKPLCGCILKQTAIFAVLSVVFHLLALSVMPFYGSAQNSPLQLYYNSRVLNKSVQQLGLLTTMRNDFKDLVFGFDEIYGNIDTSSLVLDNSVVDSSSSSIKPTTNISQNKSSVPNVLQADFAQLATDETNATIADIHQYINSVPPTYTNEKTGLFKNKNLIFVVAESLSPYVIDAQLTPTLYKMQNDGFYFENYYTGVWGVSTLDGEYTALTGTLPKQNVWSLYQTGYASMPFTIANLLKRQEQYQTFAYHNGVYNYYERTFSHPNLGYDVWQGVGNGLEMTKEWPRSDAELIDITTSQYLTDTDKPFHVYYLTISGHLPYGLSSGNAMAQKNKEAVTHLPYSEPVLAYLAANIELDKAMELLLQRLKESNMLEDTVIVICSDHYPYGLSNDEMNELAGYTLDTEFDLYKNSLIIYNSQLIPETVTKPCSSIDVLPTLCNLFGLQYESRLYSGSDIFSSTPALVPFITRSFITDNAKYNAQTNTAIATGRTEITPQEIEETAKIVNDKFSYAKKILETHYYDYVPLANGE